MSRPCGVNLPSHLLRSDNDRRFMLVRHQQTIHLRIILRKIGRRHQVAGSFPYGQSTPNLAAAWPHRFAVSNGRLNRTGDADHVPRPLIGWRFIVGKSPQAE
jgi:hypothetical protein